jgi:type III restriction enzyme
MELKKYQHEVINDLETFLAFLDGEQKTSEAFKRYWAEKQIAVADQGRALKPYRNTIPGAASVCLKVPTAGGKTLIGIHAVESFFRHYAFRNNKLVVWLVPSTTILDQTIKNFRDTDHPYYQQWQTLFQNRFQILTKEEALSGGSFNPEAVRSMLNILILSFDSFRTARKIDRKVYRDNGSLQNFLPQYPLQKEIQDADPSSLAQVLSNIRPFVVIDESHNADTPLSDEMLKDLNPAFILELTATPKDRSNIISYVSPLSLKTDNMVKLPVIVYNNHTAADVIRNAITIRGRLESAAQEEESSTGNYIRPIVLFQAEPQSGKEPVTFSKIKEKLIQFGIPPEQIAIKTSKINEIKDRALSARDCPIRYILTVNALKEGWDCPFAYVLAALSNRSTLISVEQILGRILRQPYVKEHTQAVLNMSYCLTSQARFLDALTNITKGLKIAGFTENDYRVSKEQETEGEGKTPPEKLPHEADFDALLETIQPPLVTSGVSGDVDKIDKIFELARQTNETFAQTMKEQAQGRTVADAITFSGIPEEVKNMHKIKTQYRHIIDKLSLPRFYEKADAGIFNDEEEGMEKLLTKDSLLQGFRLSVQRADFSLEGATPDIYKIDFYAAENDPVYSYLDDRELQIFLKYINSLSPDDQKRELLARLIENITRLDYLESDDLREYLNRILDNITPAELEKVKQNPPETAHKIRSKIEEFAGQYAHRRFNDRIQSNSIFTRNLWRFKPSIPILNTFTGLPKSLYEEEERPNQFEHSVINQVAQCSNVTFWHRNIERKEFCLNGWINHYPDFIIYTEKQNLILLETKGDDRDNTDSKNKIELGKHWQNLSGSSFKYFMVFENTKLDSAYTTADFINLLKRL